MTSTMGSGERTGDEFEFYIHLENERVGRKTQELAGEKKLTGSSLIE